MKRTISKKLGWAITLILWWVIITVISLIFGEPVTSLPFWAYFLVVFLCTVARNVVNEFVKKEPEEMEASDAKGDSKDSESGNS